ncbi:MAG TPA: hypothetical protein DHW34_05300 [Actinobacteria bacterium]|mgnify:FL=1|nr:hypothetical protein [Actinomycetota bacterium]
MRGRSESVDVRCRDGVPVLFRRPEVTRGSRTVHRARWYSVRAVVGYWVEGSAWWRSRAVRVLHGQEADDLSETTTTACAGTQSMLPPLDRTIWRVEARRQDLPTGDELDPDNPDPWRAESRYGVYELVCGTDGRWWLGRAAQQ